MNDGRGRTGEREGIDSNCKNLKEKKRKKKGRRYGKKT